MRNALRIFSSSALPFSLLLAVGCVAEDEAAPLDDAAEQVSSAQSELALCYVGTTPPPADWTHSFASDPNQIRSITDYGNGSCDKYVVRLVNGGSPDYEQGYIKIYTTGALPTTPEACVGTSLTVRKWTPPASGSTAWTSESKTTNAEWTASGCVAPQLYSSGSFWTSGIRFEASSQRFYCPNGGPLCAQQYGLPIKIKVELD